MIPSAQVSSLTTGSVTLPSARGAFVGTSFELIQRTTLTGSQVGISFTSITGTYKHLQIRGIARSDRGSTPDDIHMKFNGGGTYSTHRINNDGTTSYAEGGNSAQIAINRNNLPSPSVASNYYLSFVVDILDYANTTTLKTAKIYAGLDNGTTSYIGTQFIGGMCTTNTNAITSISFTEETGANFISGTSIGLYGIKGA